MLAPRPFGDELGGRFQWAMHHILNRGFSAFVLAMTLLFALCSSHPFAKGALQAFKDICRGRRKIYVRDTWMLDGSGWLVKSLLESRYRIHFEGGLSYGAPPDVVSRDRGYNSMAATLYILIYGRDVLEECSRKVQETSPN